MWFNTNTTIYVWFTKAKFGGLYICFSYIQEHEQDRWFIQEARSRSIQVGDPTRCSQDPKPATTLGWSPLPKAATSKGASVFISKQSPRRLTNTQAPTGPVLSPITLTCIFSSFWSVGSCPAQCCSVNRVLPISYGEAKRCEEENGRTKTQIRTRLQFGSWHTINMVCFK